MDLEFLAWGYGLVEGPRTDAANNLYFTDIRGGGVFRRSPDGDITTLIPGRKSVGGLAVHADGGLVVSGKDVSHWKDGEFRVLLAKEGVSAFNDLQPDPEGRIIAGAIRMNMEDPNAEKVPGECYRIGLDGSVDRALRRGRGLQRHRLLPRRQDALPLRLDDQGHLGPRRRCRRLAVEPPPHRPGRVRAGHPRRDVRRRER